MKKKRLIDRVSFHRTRWSGKSFYTPYIGIVRHGPSSWRDKGTIQISFVFINFHFWISIEKA
jgi:hypothetical protein